MIECTFLRVESIVEPLNPYFFLVESPSLRIESQCSDCEILLFAHKVPMFGSIICAHRIPMFGL